MTLLLRLLNGECTEYKRECLKDMRKRKIRIGKYAHLRCQERIWKPILWCMLVGCISQEKHKCKVKGVTGKRLNSLAAEQLWSRMHTYQSTISRFSRPHYRCFPKHYCKWRNNYVWGNYKHDTNPSVSCKQSKRKRYWQLTSSGDSVTCQSTKISH